MSDYAICFAGGGQVEINNHEANRITEEMKKTAPSKQTLSLWLSTETVRCT